MMTQKALVNPSHGEGAHGEEMRRRIADCRERLRRGRAARRIAERASPQLEALTAEGPESAPFAVTFEACGRET
jgi:hypothetical protein